MSDGSVVVTPLADRLAFFMETGSLIEPSEPRPPALDFESRWVGTPAQSRSTYGIGALASGNLSTVGRWRVKFLTLMVPPDPAAWPKVNVLQT
jgi:hypothetical protein